MPHSFYKFCFLNMLFLALLPNSAQAGNALKPLNFFELQQDIAPYSFFENVPNELTNRDQRDFTRKSNKMKAGGFLLQPKLNLNTIYDDNVYASSHNEKKDIIIHADPSLKIIKDFGSNTFQLNGGASFQHYFNEDSENAENYDASFKATIKPNSKWEFPLSVQYENKARERQTPTTRQQTNERLDIDTIRGEAGFKRFFNHLSLTLLGKYTKQTYEDGAATDGTPVIYSTRDNQVMGGLVGLEYTFLRGNKGEKPEASIFANYEISNQSFDNAQTTTGVTSALDNTKHNALLGFRTSYKDLLYADLAGGIIQRKYDQSNFDSTTDYDLRTNFTYKATPKMALIFGTSREIDQQSDFQKGLLKSNYNLGLNYEIYHNLYWENLASLKTYEYDDSTVADMNDYKLSSKIHYFMNRTLKSVLGLNYSSRESDDSSKEFDRFSVIFHLEKTF